MVGSFHLPQVAPVPHSHHALDAQQLHLLGLELLLLLLSMGRLGFAMHQRRALQLPQLREGGGTTVGSEGSGELRPSTRICLVLFACVGAAPNMNRTHVNMVPLMQVGRKLAAYYS